MSPKTQRHGLLQQGFLLYLGGTLLLSLQFLLQLLGSTTTELMDALGYTFYLASCLSHAACLMLPAYLIASLLIALRPGRYALWVQTLLTGLMSILCQLDAQVYAIYRFHINGFILNMVFGPGAGEVFNFDTALYLSEGMLLLAIGLLSLGIYLLTSWLWRRHGRAYWGWGLGLILGATLLAHLMHIYGAFVSRPSIVRSAKLLPYYFPTTSYSLMLRLGFHSPSDLEALQHGGSGLVNYPRRPLVKEQPKQLPNILIILLDSWNKRALTPETMPATYAFAQRSQWYTDHKSASNGTRSGVYGLFFGLSCYYWEEFEASHVQPLLISRLSELGYDMRAYPSATLENPNFASVLFKQIPGLRTSTPGASSLERDRRLTEDYLSELPQRQASGRPLFSFLFFDLPHSFELPKELNQRFSPAWDFADYTRLSKDSDPTPMWNLYRNTCYQDDLLLRRIFASLQSSGALENTIVILTGDHGQEFNESGRNYWGHNSNFADPQLGVPFICHFPGQASGRIDYRTTHYDLVATLMHDWLGVKNDPSDYSMGRLLSDPTPRPWHIVGSNLNYAFIIEGDTILEKTAEGALEVYDPKMKPILDYKIDNRRFNEAVQRLNSFFRQ